MKKILFLFISFLFFSNCYAKTQLKLATLAPEGTSWGKSLKKFAKEVESITNGDVTVKVYYGGVSGDESDVLRKIRIGQLHGGVFTGKVLGDIFGDIRAVEIPFTFFGDSQKASVTLKKLAPKFEQGLKTKGFVSLGFYDLGQVYVVSTKKITGLNELKGVKIWAWEGDQLVQTLLDTIGLVSVPLALPDVLSSLSTGIIHAAYAPPLAILALQWHTKIKYLVNFPTAFSVGALLVSDKMWTKINVENQKKILELSRKLVNEANQKSQEDSSVALEQLKKMGIEFISFPEKDYQEAGSVRSTIISKLKGKYISREIIETLEKEMK